MNLTPVQDQRGIYTATIFKHESLVVFTARDRAKPEFQFNSVTVPSRHWHHGKALASEKKLPLFVAISVSVKGKFADSWIITGEMFSKTKTSDTDFSLAVKTRELYQADKATTHGETIEILAALETESKAVTESKPAAAAPAAAKAKPAKVKKAA